MLTHQSHHHSPVMACEFAAQRRCRRRRCRLSNGPVVVCVGQFAVGGTCECSCTPITAWGLADGDPTAIRVELIPHAEHTNSKRTIVIQSKMATVSWLTQSMIPLSLTHSLFAF